MLCRVTLPRVIAVRSELIQSQTKYLKKKNAHCVLRLWMEARWIRPWHANELPLDKHTMCKAKCPLSPEAYQLCLVVLRTPLFSFTDAVWKQRLNLTYSKNKIDSAEFDNNTNNNDVKTFCTLSAEKPSRHPSFNIYNDCTKCLHRPCRCIIATLKNWKHWWRKMNFKQM